MLEELDIPRVPDMLLSDMPEQAESSATTAAIMKILNILKIA